LWHAYIVSFVDDGTWTATGRKRPGQEATPGAPLLAAVMGRGDRHSPLIGFALDGYPVYGPYGWDQSRQVRRFRSSYRLRPGLDRTRLPSGLVLTPAQEGPAVGPDFPAGTFVEDYEYVAGLGDLDEHNGRFAITPEFPEGTYAYFLATNEAGKAAFPYLVGPTYKGEYSPLDLSAFQTAVESKNLRLLATRTTLRADEPQTLVFRTEYPVLEQVHEKQMHVVVVSHDLATFEHVHPEPLGDGIYRLDYRFPHGGRYWVYVDHTPPGQPQTIARFDLAVDGPPAATEALRPGQQEATASGVKAVLSTSGPLTVGQDIRFQFRLDATDLDQYLGSWGHIMIASADGADFIHAHPIETATPLTAASDFWSHSHAAPGPGPEAIETVTGFNRPGLYKVWLQVQRQGSVLTFPWVVEVQAAKPAATRKAPVSKEAPKDAASKDAIPITVSAAGYTPARIEIPPGKPAVLAFRREDAQNCAGKVVFPELGITRDLPVGDTILIPLPRQRPRTLHFACGMGMYKGSVVVR
jgi:hypothetical protein